MSLAHAPATGMEPTAKPGGDEDLTSLPLPEVEKRLGSSPEGLSQAEAGQRLASYGRPRTAGTARITPLRGGIRRDRDRGQL